jgi:hypothetical protein
MSAPLCRFVHVCWGLASERVSCESLSVCFYDFFSLFMSCSAIVVIIYHHYLYYHVVVVIVSIIIIHPSLSIIMCILVSLLYFRVLLPLSCIVLLVVSFMVKVTLLLICEGLHRPTDRWAGCSSSSRCVS